nr:polymorphic toxin-type HINT domain-containing protein [Roseateles oligotrophus]
MALTGLMPGLARSQSAPSSGSGITTAICPDPGQCFANAAARQAWAKKNNCQFLEDICEKTPASEDNKGAKPEDQGFWSSLWGGVSGALKYGYEFGKGLFQGLKGQITDLIDLISNPAEVVKGLVELGKAFYKDPKGTLKVLGELLGQEAVDTIMRATQCGAYDLGKVIGSYVSPAVALKLAGRLGKYSASVGDAVKGLKKDLGCASFAGGTLVQLPTGTMAIEGVSQGEQVLSRHDRFWTDAPQAVERTFGRMAPRYRELKTEFETFRLTDEHPLWVQGKGWTPAEDVSDEDVLASLSGDVLVLSNKAVQAPLRVYNFSVAATPNYFVGQSGLWVHNAKCALPMPYQAPKSPSGYKLGASDGGKGAWIEISRPDNAHFRYEKQITGAPRNIEYQVGGKAFDGYDAKRDVLLDAKDYTGSNPLVSGQPPPLAAKFRNDAISDARGQLLAAGGTKVEWHVASKEAAETLQALFAKESDLANLKVVWSPNIVS